MTKKIKKTLINKNTSDICSRTQGCDLKIFYIHGGMSYDYQS